MYGFCSSLFVWHPIQWWAYSWVFILLFIQLTWTSLDDKQTARVRSFSLYLMCSISALFFLKCTKSVFITSLSPYVWWAILSLFSYKWGSTWTIVLILYSSCYYLLIEEWRNWHNRLKRNVSNCFIKFQIFSDRFFLTTIK
jgi:hypothetical protein